MSETIKVNYNGSFCYKILLRDSFSELSKELLSLRETSGRKYAKICIVSDSTVADLYMDFLKKSLENVDSEIIDFVFPAGEASKNIRIVEKLYEKLINCHFDRQDLLIALGGGVVGDLTGFAAATYLRGIDFIQVPTTLLSMVDSSVGGKTGVDYLSYKNMVGAFYMPKLVYMNLNVLNTLDKTQFASGMAEVIKYGFILKYDFYRYLILNKTAIESRDFAALEHIVYESCMAKKEVVEIDPTEQNVRTYLNFGHTIGHAVEKLKNFQLYHGQCVAIGMVAALYLSRKKGWISIADEKEGVALIASYGLPISVFGLNDSDILSATKSDKKMVNGKVKFVCLEAIGHSKIYSDFTDSELLEAIKTISK